MKVQYMACAGSSSVDGKTNQLSLFHILDELRAQVFPVQLTSFCVASLFEREPGDEPVQHYQLAISLNDALIASFAMAVDFTKSRRNRSVNTIQGLSIPGPGALVMSIVQKTTVLATWHFIAIQVGKPMDPSKSPPKRQQNEDTPATGKTRPTVN